MADGCEDASCHVKKFTVHDHKFLHIFANFMHNRENNILVKNAWMMLTSLALPSLQLPLLNLNQNRLIINFRLNLNVADGDKDASLLYALSIKSL